MASRIRSLRSSLSKLRPSTQRPSARAASSQHPVPRPSELDTSRHDIVVDNQENVKSGFDSWASQTSETAFTKEELRPEGQLDQAGREADKLGHAANPLDVSPANSEVSRGHEAELKGLDVGVPREKKSSGMGSAAKNALGVKKYQGEEDVMQEGSQKGIPLRTPS